MSISRLLDAPFFRISAFICNFSLSVVFQGFGPPLAVVRRSAAAGWLPAPNGCGQVELALLFPQIHIVKDSGIIPVATFCNCTETVEFRGHIKPKD